MDLLWIECLSNSGKHDALRFLGSTIALKISLNSSVTKTFLWTPHWPKDISEPFPGPKMSLNPSLTQRCLWTPHWPKDVSEPLADPKISLNPSLAQRCLWTPHWPKDVSEPLTDKFNSGERDSQYRSICRIWWSPSHTYTPPAWHKHCRRTYRNSDFMACLAA